MTETKRKFTDLCSVVMDARLVADPRPLNKTNSGNQVCGFRVACNSTKRDDETVYIDVDCWNTLAEYVSEHLGSGTRVLISGKLISNEYTTKEGQKVKNLKIRADRVSNLTGSKKSETGKEQKTPVSKDTGPPPPPPSWSQEMSSQEDTNSSPEPGIKEEIEEVPF